MVKKMGMMAWVMVFIIVLVPATVMGEQVTDALLRQLAQDDKNIRECLSKIGPAQLKKVLEARRVSLRKAGEVDCIIEATKNPNGCFICGARRCCQWVYGQVGGKYRLLLKECAADEILPLNHFTRGFRDLKVVYPAGNTYPASFQIFTFDGMRYREKGKLKDIR
jgi:hypothetical protein